MGQRLVDGRCKRTAVPGLLVLVLGTLAASAAGATAADPEVRDFNVVVDGSHAGDYRMTVTRQDDGSLLMANVTEVRLQVLGVSFLSYTYSGREVWKDGRLRELHSYGQENGEPFQVLAAAAAQGLRVKCNGKDHLVPADVWTMTYWMLPPAPYRNHPVPLLNYRNGDDVNGFLRYVGTEQLLVAGTEQTCAHYRVSGSTPHDVWYDGDERMVRQEWEVDGHKALLEMTRVGH